MGIRSRHAAIGVATAFILISATAGHASADESTDSSITADETTDINDRQDWDEDTEVQLPDQDGPLVCDTPSTWYSITSKKPYHVPSGWNGTKFKDGPGGTMTVSVTKSGTISAEVGGTGDFTASGIIAKAKVTVSSKIGGSVTITTGHQYAHKIANNKYGHLQYGSWGYKVSWKRYRSAGGKNCGGVKIGQGTATLPTSETGWKYWETSS
ncbi:hypothetical protein [Streptomyces shenzhenensis]|uniref:hypothetical protein n=1 Tax=Streptomyces shenzhenensis TaxID=943815 RepID=UPI003697F7EF